MAVASARYFSKSSGILLKGKSGHSLMPPILYPFTINASSLNEKLKDIPVVLLVDGGTESYAEVLSANIQEKGRAQVVGVHSAGKRKQYSPTISMMARGCGAPRKASSC